MYGKLKEAGISNRDAARLLLNTSLSFDGRLLADRIEESSQLSRRIVHTAPGEIPIGLFNSFSLCVPQLEQHLLRRLALTRFDGSESKARAELLERASGPWARSMEKVLYANSLDDALYHNMCAYIAHADLSEERRRCLLYLMLFVITGCTGNPKTAAILTVDYATNVFGADFHTIQSVITAAEQPDDVTADIVLGLVRVSNGHIKAGSHLHMLHPDGTEIGLLPTARHTVTDVDEDVSRSHALIWREDGQWFLRDLNSTNGTHLILGSTGEELQVPSSTDARVALSPTDIICLGSTTRFIVMPILGS